MSVSDSLAKWMFEAATRFDAVAFLGEDQVATQALGLWRYLAGDVAYLATVTGLMIGAIGFVVTVAYRIYAMLSPLK